MKKNTKILPSIIVILVICVLVGFLAQHKISGLYNYHIMKSYISQTYGSDYEIIDKSLGEMADSGRCEDFLSIRQGDVYYRVTSMGGKITSDNHDICQAGNIERDIILSDIGYTLSGRRITIQGQYESDINHASFSIYINDNLDFTKEEWLFDYYKDASSRYNTFFLFVIISDPTTGLITYSESFTEYSDINSIDRFWAEFNRF